MKTPKPRTVKVVCDVCGLDWKEHKPDAKGKVSLDECVRLLKSELARRPFSPYQLSASGSTVSYARGIPLN